MEIQMDEPFFCQDKYSKVVADAYCAKYGCLFKNEYLAKYKFNLIKTISGMPVRALLEVRPDAPVPTKAHGKNGNDTLLYSVAEVFTWLKRCGEKIVQMKS